MNDKNEMTILKPTKNTTFAKVFYVLLAQGIFGISYQEFFNSLEKNEGNYRVPNDALDQKGNLVKEAILELIEAFPVPEEARDGSAKVVNGTYVFTDQSIKNFQMKSEKLERLEPGLIDKVLSILSEGNIGSLFSIPEEMLIKNQENEGWTYTGKDIKFDPNGIELGTNFHFSK